MRYEALDTAAKDAAFELFYWFARFEFALKEKSYLRDRTEGSKARPCWERFTNRYKGTYVVSSEAAELIELVPKTQYISGTGGLIWAKTKLNHCNNDLCVLVAYLKAVRNNLFHGGKSGDIELYDVKRNIRLMSLGKIILDQLACQSDIESDYKSHY
ncbi:hypothetical protein SAMN06297229_0257 [Pseudidiomarina planktonica]|uniref:Apea-like HEPN domain-containing protein n=1 Tax=Pseudidiomarina planktonica TaxID=1323738 RepID=A0A1Y6EA65_9GAMM|nr:hypothetical protein [Pseudidiomarina planktonica]RUO66251.1 hypothetical protein CWI77_07470 [Pseudidiomarina planktonica]SMQ59379.1 hypothetical protein SAMN06297229_0257 [Pseudidiomarina planktonica]